MPSKHNILLVDDDTKNIQLAIKILKQNANYNVVFATSGKDALTRVKEYSFDLILLDIMMPNMDGYEVCRILKSDTKTKFIPIIFLSAKNDEESITHGFDIGAVDYIKKPFVINEFLARVKTHIELKTYQDNLIEELQLKDQIVLQQSKFVTMGEMFENIVHQWKQPLSTISAISTGNIIKRELGKTISDKNEIESFNAISKNVQHLSTTIDTFRKFFKQKVRVSFSINKFLDNLNHIIDSEYRANNIQLTINSKDIYCNGFENELMQVLINILSNAKDELKKIESYKSIAIDVVEDDTNILFKIQDNAGGIPKHIINKIFNPYFTTKNSTEGTGIGLYMSQNIIQNHFNGIIEVQTNKIDLDGASYIGALFTIKIPKINI